jgi:hypothetical protein
VPTGDDGKPFLVPDKVIEMDADSTEQVEINDYVKSPVTGTWRSPPRRPSAPRPRRT